MVLVNLCLRMGLEELCCFRWNLKARPLSVSKKAFPGLQLVCYGLQDGLHSKQLCSGCHLHKRQLCFQDARGVGAPGGRDERRGLAKLLCKPRQQVFKQDRKRKRQLEPKLQPEETRNSGQKQAPRYNTCRGTLALRYSASLSTRRAGARSTRGRVAPGSLPAARVPSAVPAAPPPRQRALPGGTEGGRWPRGGLGTGPAWAATGAVSGVLSS